MPGVAVSSTGSSRVLALDAVRGIAIICVIATHSLSITVAATGSYEFPPTIFKTFDYAQFGVPLFFALSGWLMFSLYTGDRPFTQGVYWSRRIARIWPLWILFLIGSYIFWTLPETGMPIWLMMLLGLLFLGWVSPAAVVYPLGGITIQQEMGHYLLFSLFRRRGVAFLAWTVTIGFLSFFACEFLLGRVDPDSAAATVIEAWMRLSLFRTWPFFLIGGAAFVIVRSWREKGISDILPMRSPAGVAVLLAVILGMFVTFAQDTPSYLVLGFIVAATVVAIAGNTVPVLGPVLRSIGRYSYFMYFFHFWVLRWIENNYRASHLPQGNTTSGSYNVGLLLAILVVTTAVSWAAGWVSWRVLEKRVLTFAHRRVPGPTRSPAPQA
ncbi:MAG: acyltransferase [bacterium]|nr:acyltransferase [bacterium]